MNIISIIFYDIKNLKHDILKRTLNHAISESEKFFPAFQLVLWAGKTAEEATKNKELFNKVKKILEKPSQDKQREVFLTKDIPEEEDDRNEFKESFKADTIYHKLLESGDKKAAEARKHDCESKEHVVKKEVSIAAAAFANSGSGRLFIGISDDPVEVVGLKSDLSAFKNFDEYIRGISDSIKSFTKNQYFAQSIKFLIKENIILVDETKSQGTSNEVKIPKWIKTSTGWWIDGQISDEEFAASIGYLIKVGIIVV